MAPAQRLRGGWAAEPAPLPDRHWSTSLKHVFFVSFVDYPQA